jgi:hypothetical protein
MDVQKTFVEPSTLPLRSLFPLNKQGCGVTNPHTIPNIKSQGSIFKNRHIYIPAKCLVSSAQWFPHFLDSFHMYAYSYRLTRKVNSLACLRWQVSGVSIHLVIYLAVQKTSKQEWRSHGLAVSRAAKGKRKIWKRRHWKDKNQVCNEYLRRNISLYITIAFWKFVVPKPVFHGVSMDSLKYR